MIRIGWVAIVCLLLAACGVPARQAYPQHYTLGAANAAVTHEHPARVPQATLQLARISAPPWLQGTGLYYRLAYRHAHAIAVYAQSDWAAPPARLLEHTLAAALARGGGWRAVVGPGDPAQANYSLHIRLDDFSQVFSSPTQSHGELDATATLIGNTHGSVIAQTRFHLQVAAPSADAAGGVAALNRASGEFATRLQTWLRRVLPADRRWGAAKNRRHRRAGRDVAKL